MEKARVICTEMLTQRNWTITDNNYFGKGEMFGKTDKNVDFVVFFIPGLKLNIAQVKDAIRQLDEQDIKYSILIYENSITSSARRVLTSVPNITFEYFMNDDLQYNITKHKYAFPHIRLSQDEYDAFVKRMGTTDIPVIFKTDPMCRFYNFDKGDIIKVIRKNNFVSYRIVK